MASNNVVNMENSRGIAANTRSLRTQRNQSRIQVGAFQLVGSGLKKMKSPQRKERGSVFGGMEMKNMEIFKERMVWYALIMLVIGGLLAACSFTVEITPTPVVPTATAVILPGTISGLVWDDECLNYGDTIPQGCIRPTNGQGFIGNGVLDVGENGIGSTQVSLGLGLCPAVGLVETVTEEDGSFIFKELVPGDYCVTVKDTKQSPGLWTYPRVEDGTNVSYMSITVKAGEVVSNINFGRDYFDALPPAPTATPEPACTDEAQFVRDVTVADGSIFEPGESFTKTWRLRNSGTCTWTEDYALVHSAGYSLLAPDVTVLNSVVEPGELIDISVNMKAPSNEGSYEGYWKLRNDSGKFFGIGEDADLAIWVSIEVGKLEPQFPDWRGEYFSNKNLDGNPAFLKNDKQIDKTWGLRSPDEDYLPRDNFSVRWTRTINFKSKVYRFYLDITDGGKLYIDDVLVLNAWEDGERRTVTVDVSLKGGDHQVKFEYYNASGGAVAQLRYEEASVLAFEGWKAKYWMNKTLDSDLYLIRDDAEINFDWGESGPVSGGRANKFSAQWKRTFDFEAGNYSLEAIADDGIRVYVDGALVIDEWHESSGSETYSHELELNGLHEITVLYYENGGRAKVSFSVEMIEP